MFDTKKEKQKHGLIHLGPRTPQYYPQNYPSYYPPMQTQPLLTSKPNTSNQYRSISHLSNPYISPPQNGEVYNQGIYPQNPQPQGMYTSTSQSQIYKLPPQQLGVYSYNQPQVIIGAPQQNVVQQNLIQQNSGSPISNKQSKVILGGVQQQSGVFSANTQSQVLQSAPPQQQVVYQPYPQQQQIIYQTVPVEKIEYQTVPVQTIEYKTIPKTEVTIQKVPLQASAILPQASPMRESIKGESFIEYVPFENSYIEQVPLQKVDYVPVERKDIDYYAIERQREYVPVSRMEKVQELVPQETIEYVPQTRVEYVPQYRTEMVPVEQFEEKVDFHPVERDIIHYPKYERQFWEEAERSCGRIRGDYAGFYNEPGYLPPREIIEPLRQPPPPLYYENYLPPQGQILEPPAPVYYEDMHYMNPPPRYMGSEFIGPDYYGYNNRGGYEIYDSGINDRVVGEEYDNFNGYNNGFDRKFREERFRDLQYQPFDKDMVRSAENLNLLQNRLPPNQFNRPDLGNY